jgi:hypothetical protein
MSDLREAVLTMTRVKARALAEAIADDLFVNGEGAHADRLALVLDNGRHLGGWSKQAVVARIEKHFTASAGVDRRLQITVLRPTRKPPGRRTHERAV